MAAVEVAVDFFPIVRAVLQLNLGAVVGIDFFRTHDLKIREGNASNHFIRTLADGISGVAAGAGAGKYVINRPEAVVADAGFDFQARSRPPVEAQLRTPFLAPPGTRAGKFSEHGSSIHNAEEVFVVLRHYAGFVQFFILMMGRKGQAEFVA